VDYQSNAHRELSRLSGAKQLSIIFTIQRHFSIKKNNVCIKNNKIVINSWQTLTLLYCKTGKFSTLFDTVYGH
jgi:hypothetical protein